MKKILSICIPTFNRDRSLKKSLTKFTQEVSRNHFQNQVEIVVGNNGSTDQTVKVIDSFKAKYSYIRHYDNEKNLGLPLNVLKIIKYAKGEYLWIIGDDDFIYKNSLREIIEKLVKQEPDLLYLNYKARILNNNKIIDNFLGMNHDTLYKNRQDFFNSFRHPFSVYRLRSSYLSFISLNIIRREIMVRNLKKINTLVNKQEELFIHSWIIWSDFPKNRILITKREVFEQSFSHSGHSTMGSSWFNSSVVFAKRLNPLYLYILKTYKEDSSILFKIYLGISVIYAYAAVVVSFFFLLKEKALVQLRKS